MDRNILVVGSANADMKLVLPRMPKLGETVSGSDFCTNAGGKGFNQAAAVKKLGGHVSFIGCLGRDSGGELLLGALKEYGIPFEGEIKEDAATGTAIVSVVNGDNFILLNPGANALLTPDAVEKKAALIRNADYLLLQLEIPSESVIKAAEIAHEAGVKVVLNPAPCIPLPDTLYPMLDCIIPNEHEAELLTGIAPDDEESCRAAMEMLLKKGAKTAVITLGERGCCCSDGKDTFFVPAVKTRVADTTSAGDTFIGGLICRLAKGDSLESAAQYAAKAAAVTVSRSGAAVSIPYEWEVK